MEALVAVEPTTLEGPRCCFVTLGRIQDPVRDGNEDWRPRADVPMREGTEIYAAGPFDRRSITTQVGDGHEAGV